MAHASFKPIGVVDTATSLTQNREDFPTGKAEGKIPGWKLQEWLQEVSRTFDRLRAVVYWISKPTRRVIYAYRIGTH